MIVNGDRRTLSRLPRLQRSDVACRDFLGAPRRRSGARRALIRRDVRAHAAAGSSSASRLRRQSAAERKRERFFAILTLDARTSATS